MKTAWTALAAWLGGVLIALIIILIGWILWQVPL